LKENDTQELLIIQGYLANYLRNNCVLCTYDESKVIKFEKEYADSEVYLSDSEFLKKMDYTRIYLDIKKIEFKKLSNKQLSKERLYFLINDSYYSYISLDNCLKEASHLVYHINKHRRNSSLFLIDKNPKLQY